MLNRKHVNHFHFTFTFFVGFYFQRKKFLPKEHQDIERVIFVLKNKEQNIILLIKSILYSANDRTKLFV